MAVQLDKVPAYQQPFELVVAALRSDARQGLSHDEARVRLEQHGRNELAAERPVPAWRKFLAQFQDVLVVLLLIATAISVALWVYERDAALPYEAIAIGAVVLLNAVLGYIQQPRAESAMAALRQMAAAHAHVIRDGAATSIRLPRSCAATFSCRRRRHGGGRRTGDPIGGAADGRSGADRRELAGRERRLRDRRKMAARRSRQHDFQRNGGHLRSRPGVVVATGMHTEMGHIAGLLARCCRRSDAAAEGTRSRRQAAGRGGHRHRRRHGHDDCPGREHVRGLSALFDVLILGVALAVAAVPEGLPAVVTAVLSIGVQRMAGETRSCVISARSRRSDRPIVIASDKTGTLTRNEMTVREVVTASGRVTVGGTGYAPDGDVRLRARGGVGGDLRIELRARARRRRPREQRVAAAAGRPVDRAG